MRTVIIALILMIAPGFVMAEPSVRHLTLTGTGQVFVAPDMATVNLGVISFHKKASVAMKNNSAAMAKIFASLEAAGVKPRDIQTAQLSLNPRWERRDNNNRPHIIGYEAINTVIVRIRVLKSVGRVLDVLMQAGANQINNIRFGIQKPRRYQDKARRQAVADARVKAALYAKAAGVTLGQVISIVENGGTPQPRAMARMAMAAMAADVVPIAEGELGLQSTVTMVFEIK